MKSPKLKTKLGYKWIPASESVARDEQYLMLVLHGRGDKLNSFVSIKEELKIPGMNYLLLNASRAYDGGFTWYAFPPNQGLGIQKSRQQLAELFKELQLEHGWDYNKIFMYGFSQGALMSCEMMMRTPQALAGIIAISGYVYFFQDWKSSLSPAAFHTPSLVTHGIQDEDLPIQDSREHIKSLQSVGLPIKWVELAKEHEIDLGYETNMIRKWVIAQMDRQKQITKRKANPFMQGFNSNQISSSNSRQVSKSF